MLPIQATLVPRTSLSNLLSQTMKRLSIRNHDIIPFWGNTNEFHAAQNSSIPMAEQQNQPSLTFCLFQNQNQNQNRNQFIQQYRSTSLMTMTSQQPQAQAQAQCVPIRIWKAIASSLQQEFLETLSKWLIKRTFQPSIIRKRRKQGFLKRQKSVGGRRMLKRRMLKGRKRLAGC